MTTDRRIVLFVCVRNAGRSQMAQAIFNRAADGYALARSAGSDPAPAVHPEVAQALAEIGIDISAAKPQGLTPEVTDGVDILITMGCGDRCPSIPGALKVDWDLSDPAGRPISEVRAIRDEIVKRVEDLLNDLRGRRRLARAPW